MTEKIRATTGLRSDVAVEVGPGYAVLRHAWGVLPIRIVPELVAVLKMLSRRDCDAEEIAGLVARERPFDDPDVIRAMANLQAVLNAVPFLVTHSVFDGTDRIVKVEPISDRAEKVELSRLGPSNAIWLDRFAYVRRPVAQAGLCLESPLALHRAQLSSRLVLAIACMSEASLTLDHFDGATVPAIELLVGCGLIRATDPGDAEDTRLATWSFHDLLFHSRSRPGRSDIPFGAHFLHRDRLAAPPAIAQSKAGPAIDLPVPQFAGVVARDRSLTEVIESRMSVREYGEPLSIEALGEFLYRSARTRRVVHLDTPVSYDGAERPYPTGGLAGDLELYLCITQCAGCSPGVYQYEPAAHRLRLIDQLEAGEPLLHAAAMASGNVARPQVLVTITSRFARIAWKYETIAYALTLKHVGILLQTMYLVATSMGLAVCALGSGDADRAARAFQLDWLMESSVGELALGSRSGPVLWVDRFADIVPSTRAISSGPAGVRRRASQAAFHYRR